MVVILAGWTFLNDARDSLFSLVLCLCSWYDIVRGRQVNETQLKDMEKLGVELRKSLRMAATLWTDSYDSLAIKHHVILHYPQLIRRFGAMVYQSCEKWDHAHKDFIKALLTTHGSNNFSRTIEKRVSSFFNLKFHYIEISFRFFTLWLMFIIVNEP